MQLVAVQGGMLLDHPAAAAWFAAEVTARTRYGVDPIISSPAGAWRSPEMVMDMYRNPARYGATKGVAKPRALGGPGSVHENGRCVDVNNWAAFGKTIASASANLDALMLGHGFRRTIPKEPWHFEFFGGGASAGGVTATPEETEAERRLERRRRTAWLG